MKKTIFLSLILLSCLQAQAFEKPGITVRVKLEEPNLVGDYRRHIAFIEEKLAEAIAGHLALDVPVFTFHHNKACPDTIVFRLMAKPGVGNVNFDHTDMLGTISGKNVIPNSKKWVLDFAPDGTWYVYVGKSREDFVGDAFKRFKLLYNKDQFTLQLLKYRWITERADKIQINTDEKTWLLDFTFSEFPVGFQSQFKVHQRKAGQDFSNLFFVEVRNHPAANEKVKTLGLKQTSLGDETADDPNVLQRIKYKVEGLQILKVTAVYDAGKPNSNSGL
jgi:hypothetical protein